MTDIAATAAACGFTWESSESVAEVEGTVHLFRHTTSGARLMWIENADANKAFSITFKTPAADDTGVFHILEHSVLCGSKKYPVKEPFVNLLKTSMQTFLNAMTFPDKTMYPVASTNEQDLENLMDVYLDAVFHPDIYRRPQIFQQEGWHWEVEGQGDERSLVYNGVVYNEMKGALSDPDSVLYDTLSAALFPDTTYRFESGGTPEAIPSLTYEGFLDNHRRHYRPDNAYLILYGNLDLKRFLGFIDEHYLAPLAKEVDSSAGEPNPLALQAPVVCPLKRTGMATAPENACAAVGYVAGRAADRERLIATDILIDAILGSNEAPLKRVLLNEGVADDVVAYLADAIAQPFAMVCLKGAKEGAAERLKAVVAREAARLAEGGLDRDLVAAALSHAEFVMRERNFGYPDGVVLSMSVMAGWLYQNDDPAAYLRYEDAFADLRAKIDEGYFEALLRSLFLENDHWACAEVVPTAADENASEQAEEAAVTTALEAVGGFDAVQAQVDALRAAQEAPDDPAAVAKLPQLTRADIGPAPAEEPWEVTELAGMPCLRHHISTRGIAYAYRYFSLDGVTFEELPYVTVLAFVLGKLDTARHSAAELDTLVQAHLGNLGFGCEVHEDAQDRERLTPMVVAGASALSENVEWTVSLVNEVLTETDFSDTARIRDILAQWRLALEQSFATAGHTAAMARVASYYLPAGVLREALGGVDFYRFLKELLEHYEDRASDLSAKLAALAQRLFVDGGCTLSFAGSDEDLAWFAAAGPALGGAAAPAALVVPAPQNRHEAFAVPADVVFCAAGWDRSLLGLPYNGTWLLAARILSYDYLWTEVRVKGGAYGAGFKALRAGSSRFYSYRDPRIDETLARFDAAGSWLAATFAPTEAEMDGYVVSTTASLDAPVKARELLRRQDSQYFAGVTLADRAAVRAQVVAATLADVQALGPAVDALADQGLSCVFGSRDIIAESKGGFTVVDLVG
ncbi:insulinase family protein [Adlercreutzia equolifaciens]|uniref:insulinase family protein n=1 Tax=Adlercreutzia equolifaciens TaxID=446660 RepID=UPI0023B1EDEB|nr:insulinase family protein [Adlercreutzia equolifaciens]MDE8703008.1 insulinase family protein [Adlercreutzia equolifaciens]